TQADSSTTRNFGGTGLGLTISRSLAELMRGSLTVVSEAGRGSAFTLHIPLEVKDEKPQLSADQLPGIGRVLVVDDNATNRWLVAQVLQYFGIVSTPSSGAAELRMQLDQMQKAREMPGLIILDYQMPGTDGLRLAREIRQSLGEHTPPILLMMSLLD